MSPIMHILLLCAFSLGCLAMAKPSKTTAVSSTVVVETPIPIIPPLYSISQVAEVSQRHRFPLDTTESG